MILRCRVSASVAEALSFAACVALWLVATHDPIELGFGSLAAPCDEALEWGLWLELGVQLESTDGAFPAPLRRRQLAGHWPGARAELSRFGSAAALGSLRGRLWDGAYAADYGEPALGDVGFPLPRCSHR